MATTSTVTSLFSLFYENEPDEFGYSEEKHRFLAKTGKELASAILSNVFLFGLIFGLSATVNVKNLQRQLTNKFAIATGVAMQFVIMPVLGYLSVVIFRGTAGFTESMGITLLVVTSSPGGSYSNWWCSTFNADLALSVAMTTVSSILSIALLPANLFLYTYLAYGNAVNEDGQSVVASLDFPTLFLTLAIVLSAILLGLAAGYRYDTHTFHVTANRVGSICGVLLIVFGFVLSSGADGAESNFWNQDWSFYLATAFPCLIGIALANMISRSVKLQPPETVAIAIECCYQNTGIATSIAITMFADDPNERAKAVAVPLFYGVVEAIVIGIYCVYAWKIGWTKAPADEKICVVVTKTYEVEDDDEQEEADNSNNDEDDDMEQGGGGGEQLAVREDEVVPRGPFRAWLFQRMRSKKQQKSNDTMDSEEDEQRQTTQRLQRDRIGTDFTAEASDTTTTTPPSSSSSSQHAISSSSNTGNISPKPSSEVASSEGASVRDMTIPEGSESNDNAATAPATDCGDEDVFNNEGIPSDI